MNIKDEIPVNALLSPQDVADILGVKVGTLAVWRSTGKEALPFVKVGSKVKYRAEDVRKYIQTNECSHTR